MSNLRHWLWLSTRGPAPGMYAARLLEHFGTPEGAYFASEAAYDQVPDLPSKVRRALLDKDLTGADRILAQCDALDIRILTCQDAAYPQRLAQLDTAPCVLYVRGKLPQIDQEAAVAVVGARKASPYGVMVAGRMALDLARHGAVVVSGSAYGIDGAALRGALQGGGRVVSVLGNGIDVVYPPGHRDLYEDVAAHGALVSEYPPGTPPNGAHFPVRNRLIAGLSLGVLVVEGTQSSGSLITAKWALEQGRDVFAVPGGIDAPLSKGPNGLIRRGEAKLVQDAWDIIEEYHLLFPETLRPKAPLSRPAVQARLHKAGTVPGQLKPEPTRQPLENETEEAP
ncbi:MAG: DNA-protecting protein DprA, partial [Clostridiales bacterium]|nr:DNA-protecting protein DprA [Clostridiales bacterium]